MNIEHTFLTTPEIHRAIIFFNYCFPEAQIKTGYNLRLKSFYAISDNQNVDFKYTHTIRNQIKTLLQSHNDLELKRAELNLIEAKKKYNDILNGINDRKV